MKSGTTAALVSVLVLLLVMGSWRAGEAQDAKPPLGEAIGNRTYPTGSQSHQPGDPPCSNPFGCGRGTGPGAGPGQAAPAAPGQQQVYCQLNPDGTENRGPYRGTGNQIPCKKLPPAGPKVVFNYYYINGINTPLDGDGRGSCRYDRTMIKGNLLDQGPRIGPAPQRVPSKAPSIKVGQEQDVFEVETCNPSGTDQLAGKLVREFCEDARNGRFVNVPGLVYDVANALCADADDIDRFRANGAGGMSPGDIVEAFRQSLGIGFRDRVTGLPITGIEFTKRQPEVARVARIITDKYQAEMDAQAKAQAQGKGQGQPRVAGPGAPAQARPALPATNYFIVVAHSQGNFFAEGVAARLADADLSGKIGPAVLRARVGILSFGSPTNYRSLPQDFVAARLRHFTRSDDGIHVLDALAFLGSRVPFPATDDLDPLWPWAKETLREKLALVKVDNPDINVFDKTKNRISSPFLAELGLGPPAEPCPNCGALYTPLMNAHLLDNYLTDPVASTGNVRVNPQAARDIGLKGGVSPAGRPAVLAKVREELVGLKRDMMQGQ